MNVHRMHRNDVVHPVSRLALLLLMLLLAALVAAGCGEDETSGDKGDSKATSASEADDSGSDDDGDPAEDEGETSGADGSDGDDTSGGGSSESVSFCGEKLPTDEGDIVNAVGSRDGKFSEPPGTPLDESKTYIAKVETTKGDFEIEVLPKEGPLAAANFVALARACFFDGVVVHRIVKDFVIQTGDPTGTGTGGPGYTIEDDEVNVPYERGVVAMANAGPDTGGSQFFVVLSDEVGLTPDYAVFGRVADDQMAAVDSIAKTPVEPGPNGEPSSPTEVVRVTKITISER